jgi:hypothetical protein
MKISAITALIWLALAATALGQSKSSGNATSSGAQSKTVFAEVRAIVHELEGHTDKLRELLANHRSLVEQRPQPQGASSEAKKAHEEQLAKWDSAMERLLTRIEGAHAVVVETMQRLDKSIAGELPTSLGKDVAKVRNEAGPERAMAEQVLAKRKPASARKSKPAANEKPARSSNEDIDL